MNTGISTVSKVGSVETYPAVVPLDALTVDEEAFAAAYALHGNATRAFKVAHGDDQARSPTAVRMEAMRLARQPAVVDRVATLRAAAAEALRTSIGELTLQAHLLATTSLAEIQDVVTYACRVCYSADGHTPAWIDAAELAAALDDHRKSLSGPMPRPMPSAAGGFNHDQFGPPSPSCRACRGHGIAVTRIKPSSEWSDAAKALYEGVTLNDDGTIQKVLIADRSKWADMRNKLAGHYVVKTESKSFNVNYTLSAPATAQAPISAEDAIAKLRAIGALAPDDDASVVSDQ